MSRSFFPWSPRAKCLPVRQALSRFRPAVEILEERIVLNDRFVVPVGAPIDNITNFAGLQAALAHPGLNSGDIIQIEPGSSPGAIAGLTLPSVTNLTIQGDPGSGVSGTPQFTLSDTSFTIGAAQAGFTLNGVNIGLTGSGALTFNGNGTIMGSKIVNIDSSAFTPITFGGSSDVLSNSTVVSDIAVSNVMLDITTPAGGSSNLISGNTFLCLTGFSNGQMGYDYGPAVTVTDKVVGNSFMTSGGASVNLSAIYVGESVTGLSIQGNTISGAMEGGIEQGASSPQGLQIVGNSIHLTETGSDGIFVGNVVSGTTANILVAGNRVSTNNTGTGLLLSLSTLGYTGTLNAAVQGNDFTDNEMGVEVTESGSASGIDLGGGSRGSLGGNNFRGTTGTGTTTSGAIVTQNGTTGTIFAKRNLFSVATPGTVCFEGGAAIDPSVNSTNLTGNAAFVETLYIDFLHRAGDTTNPGDAGSWVNALNSGSLNQGQVVNALLRSAESLGDIVDGLYLKILGRSSDPGGRASFVSFLEHGGTIEQVTAGMLGSHEYAIDNGSNTTIIQSLYYKILGRIPSYAEVQGWLSELPSVGGAAEINDFLSSAEARANAVKQLYGYPPASPISLASVLPNLLHRTTLTSSAEVTGWVNSGLDLLSIEAALAGSGEFFTNG